MEHKFPPRKFSAKILDCTIRDGGIVSASRFEPEFVRALYYALSNAGVDIIEMGYKNSPNILSPAQYGPWRFCPEELLKDTLRDCGNGIKISLMVDIGKCNISEIPPKDKSVVDIMRCAFYCWQIRDALETAGALSELGYETALCMMASSTISDEEITRALDKFSDSSADIVYLMDSYGALSPSEMLRLLRKYRKAMASCGKKTGVHFHNNLQLAFANCISAAMEGVDYIDSTLDGFGKGAGNCPTEMLVWFLRGREYVRPLLEAAQNYMEPMRARFKWGNSLPLLLTALANVNPREASNCNGNNCAADFFDRLDSGKVL